MISRQEFFFSPTPLHSLANPIARAFPDAIGHNGRTIHAFTPIVPASFFFLARRVGMCVCVCVCCQVFISHLVLLYIPPSHNFYVYRFGYTAICQPPLPPSSYQRDRKKREKRLIKFRAEVGGPLLHGSNASHRKRKKDSGKIETIKPTYKNTSKKCLFFLSLSLFLFSHTA